MFLKPNATIITFLLAAVVCSTSVVVCLRFTTEPDDIVAADSKPLWWPCSAVDDAGNVSYVWNLGKTVLPQRSSQAILSNGTLYIQNVMNEDEGLYTCVATSGGSTLTSREATLQLAYIAATFARSPKSQTVFLGSSVRLTCEIDSLPPADIYWRANGDLVSMDFVTMVSSNTSMLQLTSVNYMDAAGYQCVANNTLLQNVFRYSEIADINVQGPPVFRYGLQPQSVPVTYNVMMDCISLGNPTPTIQWLKHGVHSNSTETLTIIQEAEKYNVHVNGSLEILNVTDEDEGYYTCKLNNTYGETSRSVLLTVTGMPMSPEIVFISANMTVMEGHNVTLQCRVDGNPSPSVVWAKGTGESLPGRYIATDPGVLVIISVVYQDSGTYVCTAENPEGQTTRTTTLDVQVGPVFLVSPKDVSVLLGRNVTLPCDVFGNPDPNVTWTTPNSGTYKVPSEEREDIVVGADGSLTIMSAALKHHGMYSCTAINLVAENMVEAMVSVEELPAIIKYPVSRRVLEGERTVFGCQASGRPAPTIVWQKDGIEGNLRTNPTYLVFANGTLVIMAASPEDAGTYRCQAENRHGNVFAFATLSVTVPPTFVVVPMDQEVDIGSTVQLHCVADGDPVPDQRWEKDGRVLVLDDNMIMYQNHTLVIDDITSSHLGRYVCEARNIGGTKTATAVLSTQDIPVFRVPPTNTTANVSQSVLLHCVVYAEDTPAVHWYKVRYDGDTGPGVDLLSAGDGRFIQQSGGILIQDVNTSDEGWYRVTGENAAGNVTDWLHLHVQTPPQITFTNSPQKTSSQGSVTLTCQSSGDPSPQMSWTSPQGHTVVTDSSYTTDGNHLLIKSANEERDGGNWTCQSCNLLACDEAFVQLLIEGKPVIHHVIATKSGGSVFLQCPVSGLPVPTLTFYSGPQEVTSDFRGHMVEDDLLTVTASDLKDSYRCVAMNRYGSDEKVFTKPTSTIPSVITRDIKSREVILTWSAPADIDTPLVISYAVQYKHEAGSWIDVVPMATNTSTVVTGLLPYTVYIFRVAAVNILGRGQFGVQSAPVRTTADVPSPPRNLHVTKVAENGLLITWTGSQYLNGPTDHIIYQYKVYQLSDTETPGDDLVAMGTRGQVDDLRVEISNISLLYVYQIHVWAVNTELNMTSEATNATVDFSPTGSNLLGGKLSLDQVIGIICGIVGGLLLVLVIVFVVLHVRHQRKSESLSLINSRHSFDMYYLDNTNSVVLGSELSPTPLHASPAWECSKAIAVPLIIGIGVSVYSRNSFPRRKSRMSLKKSLSGGQGFYKFSNEDLVYDINPREQTSGHLTGYDNLTYDGKSDGDVLLTAKNPLYSEIPEASQEPGKHDSRPSSPGGMMLTQSCEQAEIELPLTHIPDTDNFVLQSPDNADQSEGTPQSPDLCDQSEKCDFSGKPAESSIDQSHDLFCQSIESPTEYDITNQKSFNELPLEDSLELLYSPDFVQLEDEEEEAVQDTSLPSDESTPPKHTRVISHGKSRNEPGLSSVRPQKVSTHTSTHIIKPIQETSFGESRVTDELDDSFELNFLDEIYPPGPGSDDNNSEDGRMYTSAGSAIMDGRLESHPVIVYDESPEELASAVMY